MKTALALSVVVLTAWILPAAAETTTSISGVEVNWKNYTLDPARQHVYDSHTGRGAPKEWRYDPDASLEQNLIARWPTEKRAQRNQDFNVLTMARNIVAACGIKDKQASRVPEFFNALLARSDEFAENVGDKRYVVTRFKYDHHKMALTPPWTSALTTGQMLANFTLMHECSGQPGALDRANRHFAALADVRKVGELDGFWTTYRDESGYLWFEEYPHETAQSHVLNGHISTIFDLYAYWQVTSNETAKRMIQAGLYTLEKHVPLYRVSGKINDYDLFPGYDPDYGPKRTILQQKALYQISGEPLFLEYYEVFKADMSSLN